MSHGWAWVAMDLAPEVEAQIGKNVPWIKVPTKVKEVMSGLIFHNALFK